MSLISLSECNKFSHYFDYAFKINPNRHYNIAEVLIF